jgi:peptidyl-prolyl cis-trans isomerase C
MRWQLKRVYPVSHSRVETALWMQHSPTQVEPIASQSVERGAIHSSTPQKLTQAQQLRKSYMFESMNTMVTKKLLPAAALILSLAAPLATQAQNITTVNGKPVPKARFDALMTNIKADAARQGQTLRPDTEKRVRDGLVMTEIMVQEAKKRGIERSPEYLVRLEQLKNELIVQSLFKDEQTKNPVTDEELKAEYEKLKTQSAGKEYRARHILVEKEEEALALMKQLKAGGKFEELAKKNSKDTGSGQNGGDLGFSKPDAYVPEFAQALVKLKNGEMTDAPVKTQFGYHIIKLEESKDVAPPALDEIKDRLKEAIAQQKIGAFVEKVRASAKTDYFKN